MARPPIHPSEILSDELAELGITPTALARQIKVPPNRITQPAQTAVKRMRKVGNNVLDVIDKGRKGLNLGRLPF